MVFGTVIFAHTEWKRQKEGSTSQSHRVSELIQDKLLLVTRTCCKPLEERIEAPCAEQKSHRSFSIGVCDCRDYSGCTNEEGVVALPNPKKVA